mmetsp:Transcript_11650/g.31258  ORF Transcript_11650/g.31258 Transcript_11650/m.31258 type:complete len:513 (-) Transcript_11650:71-1609(-)
MAEAGQRQDNNIVAEGIHFLQQCEDLDIVAMLIPTLEGRPEVLQELVDWAVPTRATVSTRLFTEGRHVGTVKSFNSQNHYGFIACPAIREAADCDVFVHERQLGSFTTVGTEVSFAMLLNKERKPQAFDVGPVRGGEASEEQAARQAAQHGASRGGTKGASAKGASAKGASAKGMSGKDTTTMGTFAKGSSWKAAHCLSTKDAWATDTSDDDAWGEAASTKGAWADCKPGNEAWSAGVPAKGAWAAGDGGVWAKGGWAMRGGAAAWTEGTWGEGGCPWPHAGAKAAKRSMSKSTGKAPWGIENGADGSDGGSGSTAGRVWDPDAPPTSEEMVGVTDRRFEGVLKKFNESGGYGFIACDELMQWFGQDVFAHHKQLLGFEVGQPVTFAVFLNKDRKPQAKDVSRVGFQPDAPPTSVVMDGVTDQRFEGIVKKINEAAGFGFVDCPELFQVFGQDVFAHHKQLNGLTVGDYISFGVFLNKDKKPQAKEVTVVDGTLKRPQPWEDVGGIAKAART